MALYRETATGFVQEYASNPGAGYTLISTMPTTSINARAEWWRDLDKWNQTSAWHPSLGSTAQDPNDNFLQIVFTNDSALVSSDANGNVTDGFLGATTQVRVMRGSQNVTLTEGWSFGIAKSPDVPAFTYTWTGTDVRTLQITGFPTDTTSGYIRITATRTGSTTQVKDFKFLKVIRGLDGSSGVVIDLSNEAHVVPTDGNGANGNFAGCATTASIYVGSTDTSASWTWTATPSSGLSGTASNSNRTYTVSALSVDTGTVTFVATRTGFPNQTAIFTVSKAKGGLSYQIEPSIGAINKSVSGVYAPSAIVFSAFKTTTTSRETFSCFFYIERQTSLGGAWTLVYQSSTAQTSYSYTIPAGTFGVRGSIYLTVGQYLDTEAVPVVNDGADGSNGDDGVRGSRQIVVDGTSWSDAAAWNGIVTQTGTTPVLSDLVTIANAAAAFSASKFYTGGVYDGNWVTPNAYINGNLLVTGTVGADKIVSGSITTTQLNFNPVTTGNVVASINATSEGLRITGSRLIIDSTVSFGTGYNPTGKIASGGAAGDVNANTTTISGGKITTNSIAADRIVTNSITTSQLNFTPVTSGGAAADINAYTTQITGERIQTGSIVADKIDTRNLTIKDASGTTIFSAGVPLSSTYIASLTADKISSGTIAATYIYMNNVNGGIQSTTFSAASNGVPGSGAGFLIRGDGYVQLNNCDIRGSLQSSSFVSGSNGWRIDSAGNAEFNTVMVRTKNIENNSVTKMIGGSVATRSTQNLSYWDDEITINCDGGDILASVSVTLNGTTTATTFGNFTLYINGSQVDYKTCTAVPYGSSSVTVSGYYVNAPSGNVIVRLYSNVDNNSNNGGTWSSSYYAINGKK